jgi:glycosyltransferase involved in cell wall biosynthesis
MHETDGHFYNIESPSPGATLVAGRHLVRGWVLPKGGGNVVDVRANVAGTIYPAVHGLPREDIAQYFKLGRRFVLAEFTCAIALLPGAAHVSLEALDITGQWREFARYRYTITATDNPIDFAVPSGSLHWHEFGRALQTLLRRQRQRPAIAVTDLAAEVVAAIPYPRDLRHAHDPFCGHFDEPAAITPATFGRVPVLGYLFHKSQPIKNLFASFDLQAWQPLKHGLPSSGAGNFYKQFPNASHAGVYGMIDLPSQLPSPVSVRIYAELFDGSLHLCAVQRSWPLTSEEEKLPLPSKDRASFAETLLALKEAFAARQIDYLDNVELGHELSRLEQDFTIRAPATLPLDLSPEVDFKSPSHPLPKRVVVATHNLNFEGAPLFILDYVEHLIRAGSQVIMFSPDEGPLRKKVEALGATIRIVPIHGLFTATNEADVLKIIEELSRDSDLSIADLVVGNTFTTFWAILAAKQACVPSLLYVHESNTPANFYQGRVHPGIVRLIESAFGAADSVSFTTQATLNYHRDYGRPSHYRITPGWIDVARIDQWLAQNPRETLRNRLGVQPGELLVTNIGTFCERKGQHIFARAVDLLWQRHPDLAARCRFIMLGAGNSAYDQSMTALLQQLNRSNLIPHPSTADYFPYYAAADLFVCSTYEESSPRVILEAMTCRTPILSSDAHGVREQVAPTEEAVLVSAGDTHALAEALRWILQSEELRRGFAVRARAKVETEFALEKVMPLHLSLACELAKPSA